MEPDPENLIRRIHDLEMMVREFRLALDQMAEGLLLFDTQPLTPPGPRVLYVNVGLLCQTGWAAEDLIGQPLSKLYAASGLADFLNRLPVVAATGRRYHTDVPTRLADGSTEVFRWTLRAGHREEGSVRRFIVAVQRLVEPLMLAGGQTNLDKELRTDRMEALARMAAGVAHDFNNYLTAIKSGVLLAREEQDAETRKAQLEVAAQGCDTGSYMARRLLAFARGRGEGKREVIDPKAVTEEAIRLSSFGSNVRCELSVEHETGMVEGDPIRLLQVLSNLLINARQAMPGGGTVEVEVRRRLLEGGATASLPAGPYVQWVVRDRGVGIPQDKINSIFSEGYTTKCDGNGLGLPNSLRIVRDHGGTIDVRSKLGMGSEFTVYLPRSIAESAPCRLSAPASEPTLPRGGGLILVADDQAPVREALRCQIEHLGYRVLPVSSGTEAVEAYRSSVIHSQRPLAVLLDLTFQGGMTGIEAAREILAFDKEAYLVAWSGYLTDEPDERPDEAFSASLPKPFQPEELVRMLAVAETRNQGLLGGVGR